MQRWIINCTNKLIQFVANRLYYLRTKFIKIYKARHPTTSARSNTLLFSRVFHTATVLMLVAVRTNVNVEHACRGNHHILSVLKND